MSAKKTYNICVAVGKYNDSEGKEKTNWETVGYRWVKDDGGVFFTMKKTFNPAGVPTEKEGKDIFLNMFEIKEDEKKQPPKKSENL